MKWHLMTAALLAGAFSILMGCNETPVPNVAVPSATEPSAYRPVAEPKPLPPEGYVPGGLTPYPGGQPAAGTGGAPAGTPVVAASPSIRNEDAFIVAYAKRSPRMMIFVNRTLQGDSVPGEIHQDAPTVDDYQMIESSIVRYFDNSGKVRVQDSELARTKLNREQVLRLENGDPAANHLLATELQADVLIRVTAKPTTQANGGAAIRLNAKAVATTDARNLGTAFVDMPFPMSKTNINMYTRYLSEELMGQMAQKWTLPAEYDPVEVRIYKAATVEDSLKIKDWLTKTPNVKSVKTNGATGGSATSYASFAVGYAGAPEELYKDLKDGIGLSTGLKAVDLTISTISLEVTGPMNLVTTTRHVETTIETRTTEERRVEPINPAVPQN